MHKWQLHRLARIKKVETWSMEKTFRDVQLVLGQVVEFPSEKEAKVRVIKNAFDTWLQMYFKKRQDYHAAIEGHQCKIGDMVLIRQLPSRLTVDITHAVEKVVYRLGEVIDPLTDKPVSAVRYKEHLEEIRAISLGEKVPERSLAAKAAGSQVEDGNILTNDKESPS